MRTAHSTPDPILRIFFQLWLLGISLAWAAQPLTGLEASGGKRTTTLDEEYAFLAELAGASPRIAIDEVGRSVEDRPLYLIRMGYPEAPDPSTIEAGRNILFIGAQHGSEPAGREGILRTIRTLAFTDKPQWKQLMEGTPLLMIPTVNPDGLQVATRANAQGIDINRDHVLFRSPEGRMLGNVMQSFQPVMIVDAHESGNPPNNPDEIPRIELLWPGNPNTHPEILRLSRAMVEDHCLPRLAEAGYTTALWRGRGGREDVLRSTAGLRHALGMVIESFRSTPEARAAAQEATLLEVLRFYLEHKDDILKTVAHARRSSPVARPFLFAGTYEEPPESAFMADPVPAGYLLNAHQREWIAHQVSYFGLTDENREDGAVFIPMNQPAWPIIPLLMDSRSPRRIIEALPVDQLAALPELSPPPLPDPPSEPARHLADFSILKGESIEEEWHAPWHPGHWTLFMSDDTAPVLRHRVESGSRRRRALAWKAPGTIIGDVDVLTEVRAESANTLFQLPIHMSGEAGHENAYYVDVRLSASLFRINAYVGGDFSTLATVPFQIQTGRNYRIRFQREGEQLRARIWPHDEPEPSNWMVQVIDHRLHSGYVGFAGLEPGSVNDWFFLGVGVGGLSAPDTDKDSAGVSLCISDLVYIDIN